MIDATARLVFTSGLIYSAQFPFSTAIIVDAGRIAWIGDEEGLDGQLLESDVHVDLDGAFVAPGFFDAHMTSTEYVDPAIAAGIVIDQSSESLLKRDSSREFRRITNPPGSGHPRGTVADDLPVADQVPALLASRSFVIADFGTSPSTLRMLAAAGVPFAFGSSGGSGDVWDWIRHAVFGSGSGLSARAAFNATTRSGWRLAGVPDSGQLTIGSDATFNVWACEQFEVQVPDSRVSAWSTDARAGTPPLPDLGPGASEPRLIGTTTSGDFQRVR